MTSPDRHATEKGDKALKLHEQGMKRADICERLGIPATNISGVLQRAKQRREKAKCGSATA